MASIYVSFSSHIAKVLRSEYSDNGSPIDIPIYVRADSYWKHRFPYTTAQELRRRASLLEMFTTALRTGKEGVGECRTPYPLAFSEEEYNSFPDSEEKRDELVGFLMPKTLSHGRVTNGQTKMERFAGQRFRQACIYHVYDIFAKFLHSVEQEAMKEKKPFVICDAIRQFADKYDMTAYEHNVLLTQFYRRKLK